MTSTQNAETENPAIGKDVEANGIRTNYLEAGSGAETVVLVHGSGPGVTSYANWRGVLPAPHVPPRAKRVIQLYQAGGPSHLELFDAKPKLAQMDGEPMPESFTMVAAR